MADPPSKPRPTRNASLQGRRQLPAECSTVTPSGFELLQSAGSANMAQHDHNRNRRALTEFSGQSPCTGRRERVVTNFAAPMPESSFGERTPADIKDATGCERFRDLMLMTLSHPVVSQVFLVLAMLVMIAVVGFGLLIVWAFLGLFLGIPNGWATIDERCLRCAASLNISLEPQQVPNCPGIHTPDFCSLNQYVFNLCIKGFVALFSYINFLQIPWRVAILHHSCCSHRSGDVGLDFYDLPTTSEFPTHHAIFYAQAAAAKHLAKWHV